MKVHKAHFTSQEKWRNRNIQRRGVRIYAEGDEISAYCRATGEGASNFDVCVDCFEDIEQYPEDYVDGELFQYNGEPRATSFEGDADHPPFEGEDYHCNVCNVLLTD